MDGEYLRRNGRESVEEVPRQTEAEDEAVYGIVGREEGTAAPGAVIDVRGHCVEAAVL